MGRLNEWLVSPFFFFSLSFFLFFSLFFFLNLSLLHGQSLIIKLLSLEGWKSGLYFTSPISSAVVLHGQNLIIKLLSQEGWKRSWYFTSPISSEVVLHGQNLITKLVSWAGWEGGWSFASPFCSVVVLCGQNLIIKLLSQEGWNGEWLEFHLYFVFSSCASWTKPDCDFASPQWMKTAHTTADLNAGVILVVTVWHQVYNIYIHIASTSTPTSRDHSPHQHLSKDI